MTEKRTKLESRVVGKYELLEVLGEGGLATTYLARHHDRNRLVAIKAIQLVKSKNRRQIEMFEREADALRALEHPQIPTFYETMMGESDETITLYMVQEYVPGRSLHHRLSDGHAFSPASVVEIMLSCLAPLEYLHGLSPPLFHRDIKPSNIIMRSDGTCVLVDFGAVREALADPKVAGSSVVGTFGYMAPEQFQARALAPTDLYSLGATAVHLLSGRSPEKMEIRRLKPNIHRYIDVDSHLAAVLDLLMEPAAEDRYQSALSLRNALQRWVDDHPGEMSDLRRSSRFTPPKQFLAVSPAAKPVERPGPELGRSAKATLDVTNAALSAVGASPAIALDPGPTRKLEEPLVPDPKRAKRVDSESRSESAADQSRHTETAPKENKEQSDEAKAVAPKPAKSKQKKKNTGSKAALSKRAGSKSGKPKGARTKTTGSTGSVKPKKKAASTKRRKKKQKKRKTLDVPVRKSQDAHWRALIPTSPNCEPVGWAFFAVGIALLALGLARSGGAVALVLGAVLSVYGISYFLAGKARRKAQRGDRYLDHTDGTLTEVVVHTSALGSQYVVLHYRFGVGGTVYNGQKQFPSSAAAKPFVRNTLPEMIFFDEADPSRNTLDVQYTY